MLMPAIAVFIGVLVDRAKTMRPVTIGLLAFVLYFDLRGFPRRHQSDLEIRLPLFRV